MRNSTEEERTAECPGRGAYGLTGRSERRNCTREGNEKCARRDAGPYSIPVRQEGRKSDPGCGPHGSEVAAPDVGGCLTEFTGEQVCQKYNSKLPEPLPVDDLLKSVE